MIRSGNDNKRKRNRTSDKKMNKSHESWRDVRGIYELGTYNICRLYMSSQTDWYCSDWMCKNFIRLAEENWLNFRFGYFLFSFSFSRIFCAAAQFRTPGTKHSQMRCARIQRVMCNEHWPGLTVRWVCLCGMRKSWKIEWKCVKKYLLIFHHI